MRDDGPGRSRPVRREPPAAPYSTRPTKRRRDARGATGGGEGGGGEGGGGEGGGCEGGGVATVRVLPNLSPAKRATVRVVVLRRDSGVVLTAGERVASCCRASERASHSESLLPDSRLGLPRLARRPRAHGGAPRKKERKKENRQPKGGRGGRHAATTQGF